MNTGGTNFLGINVSGADISGVYISGDYIFSAYISGAYISGAYISPVPRSLVLISPVIIYISSIDLLIQAHVHSFRNWAWAGLGLWTSFNTHHNMPSSVT
jgi:hypothetical protein